MADKGEFGIEERDIEMRDFPMHPFSSSRRSSHRIILVNSSFLPIYDSIGYICFSCSSAGIHALFIICNDLTSLLNPQFSRERSIAERKSIDYHFRYITSNTAPIDERTSPLSTWLRVLLPSAKCSQTLFMC